LSFLVDSTFGSAPNDDDVWMLHPEDKRHSGAGVEFFLQRLPIEIPYLCPGIIIAMVPN
jgi:hypothetical protein